MNLAAVSTLPIVPRTGAWFRAVSPRYYPSAIMQLAYTTQASSRFYAGRRAGAQFQTLYLAQSPEVALLETENLYGTLGNTLANLSAVTLFDVEVRLHRLVDLTDDAVQAALQTSAQELTGNWKVYGIAAALTLMSAVRPAAPTQQLGAALFASGVEGFLTPSAKHPLAKSLVIFPENLQAGSFVRHTDPYTGQTHQI